MDVVSTVSTVKFEFELNFFTAAQESSLLFKLLLFNAAKLLGEC